MGNHVLGIATQVIVMAIVLSIILLFLGIGVLVLIHVCIVGRTLRRGLSEMNVNIVDRGSLGSTSMSQDDIEKLPCFDFKAKEKGTSPAAVCAVCLEIFKAGEKCRLLPSCNHSFHAECVDLWLLRAAVCPICRANADLMESGSLFGEGSSRFSESGVEMRDGENGIEIRPPLINEVVVHIDQEEERIDSNSNVEMGDVDGSGKNYLQDDLKEEGLVEKNEIVIEMRENQDDNDDNNMVSEMGIGVEVYEEMKG